jgi:hypothetical protein
MGKLTVHNEVFEVLPWLVNDSLTDRQRRRVLAHLVTCHMCRIERDRLQQFQSTIVDTAYDQDTDYRFAFRKLSDRIDSAEANRVSTAPFERSSTFTTGGVYLAAAACLLVGVLTAGILSVPTGETGFTTLSSPVAMAGVPHSVALTFEAPIQAATLRAALIETHSSIVSGPDENGTYVVVVNVPADMTDVQFIHSLQEISGIKYAQFHTADLPAR